MLIHYILMGALRSCLEIGTLSLRIRIIIPPHIDLLWSEWKHCFSILELGSLPILPYIKITNILFAGEVILSSWMQTSGHCVKRLLRREFELWSLWLDRLVTLYSIIRILLKYKAIVVLIASEQKDVLRLWSFGFVAGTSELLVS